MKFYKILSLSLKTTSNENNSELLIGRFALTKKNQGLVFIKGIKNLKMVVKQSNGTKAVISKNNLELIDSKYNEIANRIHIGASDEQMRIFRLMLKTHPLVEVIQEFGGVGLRAKEAISKDDKICGYKGELVKELSSNSKKVCYEEFPWGHTFNVYKINNTQCIILGSKEPELGLGGPLINDHGFTTEIQQNIGELFDYIVELYDPKENLATFTGKSVLKTLKRKIINIKLKYDKKKEAVENVIAKNYMNKYFMVALRDIAKNETLSYSYGIDYHLHQASRKFFQDGNYQLYELSKNLIRFQKTPSDTVFKYANNIFYDLGPFIKEMPLRQVLGDPHLQLMLLKNFQQIFIFYSEILISQKKGTLQDLDSTLYIETRCGKYESFERLPESKLMEAKDKNMFFEFILKNTGEDLFKEFINRFKPKLEIGQNSWTFKNTL